MSGTYIKYQGTWVGSLSGLATGADPNLRARRDLPVPMTPPGKPYAVIPLNSCSDASFEHHGFKTLCGSRLFPLCNHNGGTHDSQF